MAKRKRTNNDLQNITHKTKDRATWTPLKIRGELRGSPEGLTVPAPLVRVICNWFKVLFQCSADVLIFHVTGIRHTGER